MRFLPRRVHWYVHPAGRHVHLQIGDQPTHLSPQEALHLADRLVDTAEALTRKEQQ